MDAEDGRYSKGETGTAKTTAKGREEEVGRRQRREAGGSIVSSIFQIVDITSQYQSLLKAIQHGPDKVAQFYDHLHQQKYSNAELVEFALYVLENAKESTGYTAIYKAGHIIEKSATPEHIERLIKIRSTLPALKGLRDYRVDFDHYIRLLKDKQAGICVCSAYSGTNTAPSNENFKTISEDYENYTTLVSCVHCGKKYKIETDIGYHFPLYHWSNLD